MNRRRTWINHSVLPAGTVVAVMAAAIVGVVVSAAVVDAAEPNDFNWVDHPRQGFADLRSGNEPVLRYMYAFDTSTPKRRLETYKVFHHVFGPGTGKLITKGPGGLYTHHRGLFVGWRTVTFDGKSLDFWHCKNNVRQRHIRFVSQTGDAHQGGMTARIDWEDAQGHPVIAETRTVRVTRSANKPGRHDSWQIDWSTRLASRRGTIKLDGDRQHAGFQFRAAQAVADSKGARYIRPKGFPQQPQAYQVDDRKNPNKHINLGWLAMTYLLDGTRYTVEYFEDPSLPKPSHYSERPYGRFGAFFRATITPDKPLVMRYRVRITSGKAPSQKAIQNRYEKFVHDLNAQRKQ